MNGFNDRGGLRIGRWRECANNAHRFCDFDEISLDVFFKDANGLVMDDIHQRCPSFSLNLKELAGVVAKLGFIDGELSDVLGDARTGNGPDHGSDQVIHLLLSVMFYRVLSRSRASNELGNFCCCWAKRLIGGAGHRDSPENLKMTRLKSTRLRQARQECRIGVLVGMARFELTTPASRRQCSTRLSYTPTWRNYNTTRIGVFKFVGLPKIRSIGSEPV